jgi:hypothetical protein
MLYKETLIARATVGQEIREILGPEPEAPEGSHREVQLLIPNPPDVYITLETDADKKYGTDRTYKVPIIPAGAQTTVCLLPGQRVYGAARSGKAHISLIVEYRT